MPSNHLILCRPLLLPPSIFPSIRVFSNESALYIRWPKYWSFSFSMCRVLIFPFIYFTKIYCIPNVYQASLTAQLVKTPPAMQETLVVFLGQENPLEKGKASHSSILACRSPWTDCIVHGVSKTQTQLSDFHFTSDVYQVLCRGSGHEWESYNLCLRGSHGLVGKIDN